MWMLTKTVCQKKLFGSLIHTITNNNSNPLGFCRDQHPANIHSVRGQSVFFNLALTERNKQVKFDLKLFVYSLGVDIWLLSFKFSFGIMGWPPQPPRERVLKINKIGGFSWSISHWETRIGLFGAMVDGNIKFSNLFCEMRLFLSLYWNLGRLNYNCMTIRPFEMASRLLILRFLA